MNLFDKLKIYGPKKFLEYSLDEIRKIVFYRLLNGSYSQNREDLVIDKLLKNVKRGFYIDIGAYDPYRFSNTYRFYKKGWNGVNIEPDSNNYLKFVKKRSRDINLNIGIGPKEGKFLFYRFFPDTLSTFSEKSVNKYKKEGFKLVNKVKIPVKKLTYVFSKYCAKREISFMSIDVEGNEIEILKSNNWGRYRPKIICAESYVSSSENKYVKERSKLEKFMESKNYKLVYSNKVNVIYKDLSDSLKKNT